MTRESPNAIFSPSVFVTSSAVLGAVTVADPIADGELLPHAASESVVTVDAGMSREPDLL
ncbi:hypothetical protein [Amycolatopsis keratiniphila]|uniref:Uncharacterized protein n=1 Tax=Amycolatopsis keratiniphila TaxID=129921 RepID=R4SXN0_9PSEU|nr:hypothetical protein [Amycolatopsis keratiniphila]AGM07295.1 hypothetical protein AORI_4711 [Amycolatopsis keratiniphila]